MSGFDMMFFDLDGTLLSTDHRTVSPGNREALEAARREGVRMAVATGRCLGMIPFETMNLDLDYAITSNGAALYEMRKRQKIYRYAFPPEEALIACNLIEQYVDFYELFVDGNVLLIRSPRAEAAGCAAPPWGHFYVERRGGMPPMTDIRSFVAAGAPGLEKINLIECPRPELLRLQEELAELGRFDLSSSMSYGGLEVVPKACSKGNAIRWLCGELGISITRCAAFGDSSNDLDMLAAVGCGVAMENATDDLKAAAVRIAPPYDQDGIARFIRENL